MAATTAADARVAIAAQAEQNDQSSWSVLPTELQAAQGSRIALVALLYAGLFAAAWGTARGFYTFFEGAAYANPVFQLLPASQLAAATARFPLDLIAAPISIVLALLVYGSVRFKKDSHLCGLSMGLQVDGAFGIAIAENWNIMFQPEGIVHTGLSWVAFWVVLYPLLVPTVPRRALVGSLLAATMGPVAMALSIYGTSYEPTAAQIFFTHFPNYIAAGVAYVASRWVFQLGRTASRARRLGAYELGERIGRGGMGEVWKANHALLKRPAAVKLVHPERLARSSFEDASTLLRRFEREAQATARLESPHTVTLYDYGASDDGTFYYVMELLNGFDLETLVERFGAQDPYRVARIMQQIAMSLADAHHSGLVHRDIKPANVFVARKGLQYDFVKVLDFGLVKPMDLDTGRDTRLTAEGVASGTPAYMAPEVGLGESTVDGKADVYALGCVAYWLLTGRMIFDAPSPMKMVLAHINETPLPPSEVSELEVPEALDRLVMACLAKEPDARPTAREISMAICMEGMSSQWGPPQAFDWWSRYAPDFVASA